MNNEILKVMEMVENKQVSAKEGAQLIEAIKNQQGDEVVSKSKPRWLKIRIEEEGDAKVNIKIPFVFAKLISKFIPKNKQEQMKEKGIDVETLISGNMWGDFKGEEGVLVDITDENKGEKVKIWVE